MILTGRDQTLHGRWWQPDKEPRGHVLVVHGLGDHSGRYEWFAQQLVAAGWGVFAFDLPGHGLSPGRRGQIDNYGGVLLDLDAARQAIAERAPGTAQVLLGHSMGGNFALNYVLRHGDLHSAAGPLAGLLLCAPMLLPPDPPPRDQIFAAWLTGYLVPWIKFRRRPDRTKNPQEARRAEAMCDDPLMHSEITVYLATQLLAQGRWALDHARNVDVPTLVIHGDDDLMIDRAASENVAIRMGENAVHHRLQGMHHDLLQDDTDPRAIEEIVAWLGKLQL